MLRRVHLIAGLAVGAVGIVLGYYLYHQQPPQQLVTTTTARAGPPVKPPVKPVCASPVNPNVAAPTDCTPPHLTNLPPDPGKAALTEFIDTNKDGLRDEVEIWIEHSFGSSRRAVAAARQVAMAAQVTIAAGAMNINHADAKALATEKTMKAVDCFVLSVEPPLNSSRRLNEILLAVADTPERFMNRKKFELAASGHVYEVKPDRPLSEVCGYDPASLPN
jgi:hypothetical protein